MPRFSVRDLIWLGFVLAVAFYWWVDHTVYSGITAENKKLRAIVESYSKEIGKLRTENKQLRRRLGDDEPN